MERMRMPFGKYKGEFVDELPADYVDWLLAECDLRPALQAELEAQLALKRGEGVSRRKD